MRAKPIRPAPDGQAPVALRGRASLRAITSIVFAAGIGFVPAIVISSPAQAAPGDLTITEVEGAEDDALVFELRREAGGAGSLPVAIDTVPGTAVESGAHPDYTAVHTSVIFADNTGGTGDQVKRITVRGKADAFDEADETFQVKVDDGTNPVFYGTGILADDDDTPTYTLSAGSPVAEGDGTATVTATLSAPSGRDIDIPVQTADGSADAGQDFVTFNAAIHIAAYASSGTASINITDDALDEEDTQSFTVARNGASTNADDALSAPVTVAITDNDTVPSIILAGAGDAVEGTNLTFSATLSAPSERQVTATVNTAAGLMHPATPDTDYTSVTNGTLTFAPSDTSEDITVSTLDDSLDEFSPEMLSVGLTGAVNATVAPPAVRDGGISDNDNAPTVTLSPSSVDEDDTGTHIENFTVELDAPSGQPVTVGYSVTGDTATAGSDFTATSGTVTFDPGQTSKTFGVVIRGDRVDEGTGEAFNVTLSNTGGTVGVGGDLGTTSITIDDDDDAPTFSVANVTRLENAAGPAQFVVTLSNPTTEDITFAVDMDDVSAVDVGSGTGSNDYNAPSTVVTIPGTTPGGPLNTTATIDVVVNGDTVFEGNETATLTVDLGSGETDATGPADTSTLTITNDDAAPSVVLSSESGAEGTDIVVTATVTGVAQANTVFALTLEGDDSGNHNPAESSDFVDNGNNATIAGGTASGSTVTLRTFRLNNDTIDEPAEAIRVTAEDVAGNVATASALQSINDDPGDLPPSVAIQNETIGEDEGSVDVGVSLSFDGDTTATEQDLNIPYWTFNGGAHSGQDYTAKEGTLTVDAGDMSGEINVLIDDDNLDEPDQSFGVKIGSVTPSAAEVTDDTGVIEILDDDDTVAPTLSAPSYRIGAGSVDVYGKAREGTTVQLWAARYSDDDEFAVVAYTTAGADGSYGFTRYVGTGYRFFTKANGLTSVIRTVRVAQAPVLTGGSTAKGTVALKVVGNPKAAGQAVQIQRANADGTWTTVASGKTDADGAFARTFTKLKSGTAMYFRAYIPSNTAKGEISGFSAAKRVGVR